MLNQWSFVNTGFNGATLFYNSYTSAGTEHRVSTFTYLNLGINPNGGGLQMGQTATGTFITASPGASGGLDANPYVCGLISATSVQETSFTANRVPINTGPMNWGVTCMQNTPQLQGGGACYALQADSVNFGNFYRLVKMTAGPDYSVGGSLGTSYILLGTTSAGYWNLGATHNMSLFWFSDPYYLKGTWLVGIVNGVTLFNIVHTGSDAITTAPHGQGIYCHGATNASAVTWYSTALLKYEVLSVNGVAYPPS